MPHKTSWEKFGLCWTFYGVVSLQEVHDADGEMYSAPQFDELKYFIWDGSKIEKIDYDIDEADQPAAIDKASSQYKPYLKGALIGEDEKVRLVIKRYIETSSKLNSSWELKLFSNLFEARQWLGYQ